MLEMSMGESVAREVVVMLVKAAMIASVVFLAFVAAIFDLAMKSR